jgi:hypothetical protein
MEYVGEEGGIYPWKLAVILHTNSCHV